MLPWQRREYQINGVNGIQQEMPPERPTRRRQSKRNSVAPVQGAASPTLWVNDIDEDIRPAPRSNHYAQEMHI